MTTGTAWRSALIAPIAEPTDDATQLWQRAGDTFDTLTLSPSIDASKHGHWHGFIQGGEIR
jgi:hypothetical protein